MVLYHGTSSSLVNDIHREGLRAPYVTDDQGLAGYYADCAVEEHGGEPVILTLEIAQEQLLADVHALSEPVLVGALRDRYPGGEEQVWAAADSMLAELGLDQWAELPAAATLRLVSSARAGGPVPVAAPAVTVA